MHAARNGHISISRQRTLACRLRRTLISCERGRIKSLLSLIYHAPAMPGRFTANYARRTTAPQGATHQLTVRSQGSLLVAGISDGFATGAYGQQAAAPLIHHSSFIIHHSSFIIHHWPTAPWMLARAFAKQVHCQESTQNKP